MDLRRTLASLTLVAGIAVPLGLSAARGEPDTTVDAWQARTASAQVPVSFVFVTREEGHELLLTDVHVAIVCPVVGKLFDGVSEGPHLIANLPGGRYEVIASHHGRAQRIALTVANDEPRRISIYW
jgi:hypothetical protein